MIEKNPQDDWLQFPNELVGGIKATLSKRLDRTRYDFLDGTSCIYFDDGTSETHFSDGEIVYFKPSSND